MNRYVVIGRYGFVLALISTQALQPVWAESESALETIVVTGTRAQALPGGATIIDENEVQYVAPVHPSELSARVPGMWISRGGGQEHLTALRSPVWSGPGSCGEVVFAEDGVPVRPAGFCNVNQFAEMNVEQSGGMEILRGTQGGALYGANALHGVINVLSMPVQQQSSLRLEGGPNDYARTQWVHGYGSGYVAALAAHDGGYQDSSGYDQQKLAWKHQQAFNGVTLTHSLSAVHMDQQSIAYLEGEDAYRDDSRQRDNDKPDAFRDLDAIRYVQSWEWQQGDYAWVVKPYLRHSEMNFTQHFNFQQPLEKNGQDSAGVQMTAQRLNLGWGEWQSGMMVETARGWAQEWQTMPTVGTAIQGDHYDYRVDMDTAALWQDLTVHVTQQLELQAGIRVDRVLYDYDNRIASGRFGRFTRPADRTDGFTLVSPRAGLVYTDAAGHEWYASVSHASRAPQTAELYRLQGDQQVADIGNESADGGEVGWRGTASAGTTWQSAWNLTLFSMHKDGVIIRNSNNVFEDNAKTTHRGVELAWHQVLPASFYFQVAATYAEHRYDSDVFDKSEGVDGNIIDTAPREYGALQVGWEQADTHVELEWVHMGDYWLDPEHTFDYSGHDLFNFRTTYKLAPEWEVFARLMNITDRDYAERADVTPVGTIEPRYFVGLPRSLFLGIEWHY